VAYKTSIVPEEHNTKYSKIGREELNIIKTQMLNSQDDEIKALADEIFNTKEGEDIIEEYLSLVNKKILKLSNK
jgi:hypothetical protein